MSPQRDSESLLEQTIWSRLEAIIDPCSRASGAPAGLVSMGLVGAVNVENQPDGAHVHVTLYITEPGCMMGALFQLTAERDLIELPGVSHVQVEIDYSHVWGPEQMTSEYRRRLAEIRECRRRKHQGYER
jgi:metal-sulfur cluster biosynthetic enzyme